MVVASQNNKDNIGGCSAGTLDRTSLVIFPAATNICVFSTCKCRNQQSYQTPRMQNYG